MRATIIRWFPETRKQAAYGFAKLPGAATDLLVYATSVIEGEPFEGAEIECKYTPSSKQGRLRAIDVLIPEQAAHLFRDDVARPFRLIVARHSD